MAHDAPEPQQADAPPKARSPMLMIVAVIAIGAGVGAAAGTFVVGPALAKGIVPTKTELAAAAHTTTHAAGEDAAAGDEGDEAEPGDEAGAAKKEGKEGEAANTSYVVDNLVLNPAGSGGTRFLLLTATFDMKSAAQVDALKQRDAEVRDAVLKIVGSKTVEQLADMSLRESLKDELRGAIGTMLRKKTAAQRVYFPQFVIQ